ncbi:ACT domain-containing protein [Bifidobacterium psychraerophilum]|jgi:aspartate kinase|uniref:aspartate kinase n=1 Tax=Bifidobacterium psychraerophilum TaxID=218140 RepID=A0A087CFD0_9BIFI|nr:ACT domain-containing protein [Bifidobacterium psychraerophilum]KFI81980.1 aspartate kinase [Bifidobacterium psychraerophilum]MCI1660640.1 ACT domain-containing protein [Bifidobacterium psychraerophilum]MCI1803841.1 ACT domain-containing protein [Bifidobacterium psychraerophilum]MCI2176151.1 ACT domain-containing protein [Bifidobacterium psychraerophilum]MCI2181376.1 ACT domain-containing protein [Bifidobacterium psychraerophilum]
MNNNDENKSMGELFPDLNGPESPVISGVAHDRSEAQVTLRAVPDLPGVAAQLFTILAEGGINIDMIVQAGAATGTADISFTMPQAQTDAVETLMESQAKSLGYDSIEVNTQVGKVTLVGVGMKTHSGITATFFKALSAQSINVLMISTSEIRISAMVPLADLDDAVRAIHTAFNLDAEQIEAVVYGGTGR